MSLGKGEEDMFAIRCDGDILGESSWDKGIKTVGERGERRAMTVMSP